MSNIENPSVPPGGAPPTTPTSPDAPAQASMTSLPHTNLDSNAVNKQVNSIFEQAGLVRGADGGLTVKDSSAVGKTQEVKGLQNFEQVYGASESQLKPPGPPRVELNEAGRVGAEAFAANMDKVIDDILVRPKTQQPLHTKPQDTTVTKSESQAPTPSNAPPPGTDTAATSAGLTRADTESHGNMADPNQKPTTVTPPMVSSTGKPAGKTTTPVTTGPDTTPVTAPATDTKPPITAPVSGATPTTKTVETSTTGTTKSLWKLTQDIQQSPEAAVYRANMASNPVAPTDNNDIFRRITDLTADVLLAAFLKLNIMDPNNSVETHQKLHGIMSKLRERAIADAKQKMKVAAELREEAEKEADNASYVSNLVATIRIVVCVIALICAFIPGVNVIVAIVAAVIVCACTIVEAKANKDAAVASCDAAQAGVMGKRAQLMAERAQEQIEEEAEIIKMVIESKNKMVDAVIRMMNAMFGASQKLMSAGMAKG